MRRAFIVPIMLCCLHLVRCTGHSPVAGGTPTGSETTNGIAATVHYPNGTRAVDVPVVLLSSDYLATSSDSSERLTTFTDKDGSFSFTGLKERHYTIEIAPDSIHGSMVSSIAVSAGATRRLGKIVLDTVGTLLGSVRMTNLDRSTQVILALYGLARTTVADKSGSFRFERLAPGAYRLHITSSNPGRTGFTETTARVEPGATTRIPERSLPIDYRRDSLLVSAFLYSQGIASGDFDWVGRAAPDNNRIRSLDLCSLGITDLHGSFGALDFVRSVKLSHNSLLSLPSAFGELDIYNLTMKAVGMTEVFPQVLELEDLILLNARDNDLSRLPEQMSLQTSLRVLYLSGNRFVEYPAVLTSMSWLTDVDLSYNAIDALPDTINRYPRLWQLNVSGNKLTRLPTDIAQLPGLEVLQVHSNQLTALPDDIGMLKNLRVLYASNNSLHSVPASIGQCAKLTDLRLQNNHIEHLPLEIINLSPQTLRINNNRLCTLESAVEEWIDSYSTATDEWRAEQTCE